jgi:hypothetical protein
MRGRRAFNQQILLEICLTCEPMDDPTEEEHRWKI